MKNNKYILFGGLLITLFLLLLILPSKTLAFEGDCVEKYCLVPAPTILVPEANDLVGERPVFRALTWKPTIVKVFVDGVELTNVEQKKHNDQHGSVFVRLNYDLRPGNHYVYAIAYHENDGWGGQSKESKYVYFTVKKLEASVPFQEEILSFEEKKEEFEIALEPVPEENQVEIAEAQEEAQVEVTFGSVEGQVEITEQGLIEGGVFVEKDKEYPVNDLQEAAGVSDLGLLLQDEFVGEDIEQTEKRNRFISLVMLLIILVITIIWFSLDYINNRRMRLLDKEDEGYLPPPPEPPKDSREKSEEISYHQVTDEWDNQIEGPPPSPSSPYPMPGEELKVIDEEKRNDLGL